MYLLSIDVGIKHLAYILVNLDNNIFTIESWDVVDLCNSKTNKCEYKNKPCNKNASLHKNNSYFCKIHAKKHIKYILPCEKIKSNDLQKSNIQRLKLLAETYNIHLEKHTKSYVIKQITNFYKNNIFEPIKKTNANSFNLVDLGISLKNKFDSLFNDYTINTILIENQIGPIAIRMKSLQAMITQYFIMKNCYNIHYISSTNKLKVFEEAPSSYKERKQLSIEKTFLELKKPNIEEHWSEHFSNNKKKDDLADALLQLLFYLNE